jgi:signal transduction histidine kinase
MDKARKSIVYRCSISIAICSAILCLVVSLLAYNFLKSKYEYEILQNAQQNITKVNTFLLGYFYNQNNWIHLQEHVEYLNSAPNNVYNYILNSEGNVDVGVDGVVDLYDQRALAGRMPWEPKLNLSSSTQADSAVATKEMSLKFPDKINPGDPYTIITAPILCRNVQDICGYLRVAINYKSVQATLQDFKLVLMIGSVTFTLLSFMTVFYVSRRYLRGIRELSLRLHEFSAETNLGPHKIQVEPRPNDPEEEFFLKKSIQSMLSTKLHLEDSQKTLAEYKSEADLCFQLAHDLRSPIAALDTISKSTKNFAPAQKEVLKSIITRMNGITKDLVNKAKQNQIKSDAAKSPEATHVLSSLVQVIEEIKSDSEVSGSLRFDLSKLLGVLNVYVIANPDELKRIFSGLIYNAAEATRKDSSVVNLSIAAELDDSGVVRILFQDDGCGIPEELQNKVFDKGYSYNKPATKGGSGLGLFYAKTKLAEWGASISLKSSPEVGTVFVVVLNKAFESSVSLPLKFSTQKSICVIDDEPHIIEMWKELMPSVIGFDSPEEYLKSGRNKSEDFCIVDYHFFNSSMNGLDLIEKLEISGSSILSTNLIDNPNVYNRCAKLKVAVLPKSFLNSSEMKRLIL